jgi:hypothetical protein
MTDVTDPGAAHVLTTTVPGVVSVFLTTVPVDQLDRYRVPDHQDVAGWGLEADSGLVGVAVAELVGYSAGESFADAAALDLTRLRNDDHTGLVLVYDHDARRGSGVREGSGMTLVGVYSYDWQA